MSKRDEIARKASAITLDDEPNPSPTSAIFAQPRTAPGQLMGLQGKLKNALDEIERLKAQGSGNGAIKIPVTEIFKIPGRQRVLSTDEKKELTANLTQHPLIHPIVVRPKSEQGYELISGHNRLDIYKELGRTEIDAFISDVEASSADLFAFYANLLSPSLPDFEKYTGFKRRQAETGMTQKDLAEEAGISVQKVSSLFAFGDLPPEAIDILSAQPHVLGADAAVKLARAGAGGRHEKVIEAVRRLAALEEGFTQAAAVQFVNALESKKQVKASPIEIRAGKQKFCTLDHRSNVVSVKFAKAEDAETWAKKFEQFLREQAKP